MMNESAIPAPSENLPDESSSLVTLLVDQRRRWEHGDRILVEAYFDRFPVIATNGEAALDLIGNELLLRQEIGESPRLEEYIERFPQWSSQLRMHFEVEAAIALEASQETVRSDESKTAGEHSAAPSGAGAVMNAVAGYEILEEVGRGAQSIVYKARHVSLNRFVALKMILGGAAANADERARFRREAQAVAHLKHPNIVQIYDVGEQDGRPYLALEYVAGGVLSKKLGAAPQTPRSAAQLAEILARAMDAAHQVGIIHRDLKPANVLLADDGSPKITDFGLAKRFEEDSSLTQTGCNIMGTPSYMAPEQAAGKSKEVGPAADVYALGAILYEMLTGRPPFTGATPWDTLPQVLTAEPVAPRRLQPKAPRDLETICLKCLEKRPNARYASAGALADDLRRFLAGEPIDARPASMWERSLKWARRRPAAATLIVSAILLLALGVGAGVYHSITIQRALNVAEGRRIEAEHEHEKAKENLQQARRILNQMVIHLMEEMAPSPDAAAIEETRKDVIAKAQAFSHSLLAESSRDPALRKNAALDHLVLADMHRLLGQDKEARAALDEAVRLAKELVKEFPKDSEYSLTLAATYHDLAGWLFGTGQLADSQRAIDQAIDLFEQEDSHKPNDSTLNHNCGNSYNLKGMIHLAADERAEGQTAFRKAIEFQGRAAKLDDTKPRYRLGTAMTYNNLGNLLERNKSWDEGTRAFEESLKLTEALAMERPDNPTYQQHLAGVHQNLGRLQISSGKMTEGSAHLSTAIGLASQLLEKYPLRADTLFLLAKASMLLGQTQFLLMVPQGDLLFLQGAGQCKSLMLRFPDNVEYRSSFVMSHELLFEAFRNQNRPADAEKVAFSAFVCFAELQGRLPDVFAPLAQQSLERLIDVTLEQKRYRFTVGWALQLPAAYRDDAKAHYRAAEVIANCLDRIENDTALSEQDRTVFKAEYAKVAIEQLRVASSKGFPADRKSLKTAPAFKALQPYAEFQEMTAGP